MYTYRILLLLLPFVFFITACNKKVPAQKINPEPLYNPEAEINRIATGFSFTEGPAVSENGNVYFTDQPTNRILIWNEKTDEISVFSEAAQRANGLYIDHQGRLLACADKHFSIIAFDLQTKKKTELVKKVEGKELNGPNDLWVDEKGGIYFTDPYYQREYWKRTEPELEDENVYYLSPDGMLSVVATGFEKPNGIIGDTQSGMLYIADIQAGKTYRFQRLKNGQLSNRELFCEMGSDGMTIDHLGNIYLTGQGVTVFDKYGKKIDHIHIPEGWTANVTFAGKDESTLFITASESVYTMPMNVHGIRWHD